MSNVKFSSKTATRRSLPYTTSSMTTVGLADDAEITQTIIEAHANRLSHQATAVGSLANRAHELANRLLGPEDRRWDGTCGDRPEPQSAIAKLSDAQDILEARRDDLELALQRLERL